MRGGWQRDEQFDHDCLLPEREEIEEAKSTYNKKIKMKITTR